MKYRFIILGLLSVVGLSSCKYVKIKDGQIPVQYLEIAKKYEGVYSGSFQGRKGALKFDLQGTRAVLSFVNGHDDDILGSECDSKILELTYLKFGGSQEKPILRSATFRFEPGSCKYAVSGRTLEINDNGKGFEVEILEQTRNETNCHWSPMPGGGQQVCESQIYNLYLTGSFKK